MPRPATATSTTTARAGVSLQRDFYSPSTRYAGALNLDRYRPEHCPDSAPPPGQPYMLLPAALHRAGCLGGPRPAPALLRPGLRKPRPHHRGRPRLRTNYSAIPPHATDIPTAPTTTTAPLLLGTVGYSVRRYYKDRYLFGFGRTEDVPTGTLLSFTAGYDVNSVVPRRYFDVRAGGGGLQHRAAATSTAPWTWAAYQLLDASRALGAGPARAPSSRPSPSSTTSATGSTGTF